MKVGGRDFNLTMREVKDRMAGEAPEPIQKHAVAIDGREFPPKQVLARVTGWDRQSFTTMEAQRVLRRLGFDCYPVGSAPEVAGGTAATTDKTGHERIMRLEAALVTAQEAIAGLSERVRALELR